MSKKKVVKGQKEAPKEEVQPEVAKPKRVAIVGFSSHKTEAPYKDESWEIWGLNDLYESIPRWNRWFEMHSDKQIADYGTRKTGAPYLEGLAKLGIPVFMQKPRAEVPLSVEYPIKRVVEVFGDYFTNSISYMIALAIMEQYEEIGVYGVDMAQDSEYGHQRPSCEYMIGYARGRGIKVFLPKTCDLVKMRFMYGYEDEMRTAWDARVKEIYDGVKARHQAANQQQIQINAAIYQYMGAEDAIRTLQRIHV